METNLQETVTTAWHKSKWIVKGFIIGFLALLMMIPMLYVKNLIIEREERQREVTHEISSKWAGKQNIIGPVIGIPYWESDPGDSGSAKIKRKHIAYFLPDKLNIQANVNPKEKHRGIFKVMLYDAKANISGTFGDLAFAKLNIPVDQIIWTEAFVTINITDSRGLNDQLMLKWKDSTIELSPQANSKNDGMTALLKATSAEDFKLINFAISIDINGSEQLFFTPVGKTTIVDIESPWNDPSFSGTMLPQTTAMSDSGFKATWKSMAHTRSFPQQWIDKAFSLDYYFPLPPGSDIARTDGGYIPSQTASIGSSAFGVDLFIPVNGYQKTLRTVKYAMLCILLTFAAFFLIETAHKKSAHPFQYGLVGLALILFYTLLLSFSEYTGFNAAYIIASVATIGLIAWFVKSILQSGKATTILSVVLVLVYSYIFSLLQLQDYSLLLGSIGLFLTLAVIMYFSKRLKW
jgi:inner membrane protein